MVTLPYPSDQASCVWIHDIVHKPSTQESLPYQGILGNQHMK